MSWVQSKLTNRPRLDEYTLKSGEEVVFERSGSVQIQVIDTGAGMSQEQLAALFRDGIQFNVNELQAGQGSGLGLFIAMGIVKQHGGDLEVSSEGLGRGTTFTCTLPLYHVPAALTETTSTTQAPPDEYVSPKEKVDSFPLRILVVDDIATNRKLLTRLSANRGHSVDDAKDGREAVNKVKNALRESNPYDTILMDYEMPVLRGPEAAKEIRELGCDSFIVGITGNVLAEDISYFTSCGADFVLSKPVDFCKLEELWVEHGIQHSSLQ
jgi:CheY-like chemotaxis protein